VPGEKYLIEIAIGAPPKLNRSLPVDVTDTLNKEPPLPKEPKYLLFSDVKTLAVNDLIKDRLLSIKLIQVNSKKVIATV